MSTNTKTTDPSTISLLLGTVVENAASTNRTRAQQRVSLITKRRKMSRRANLIGICGVCSLFILLLIATTQHRPLPASLATSSGSLGGGGSNSASGGSYSGFSGERHVASASNALQQPPVIVYNLTASISDVLAAQRKKIFIEMENFEYPAGRYDINATKLSDLTPETEGTPIRSVVVTSWRSGSTFLGDILNALPGNYYHYEPLLNFGIKQIRDPIDAEIALRNLKNLLLCDYGDMDEYLDYGKTHTYLFEHNERLWSVCREFPHFCWRAKLLIQFCKLFPLQSMKTVRLRLSLAENLLEDKDLNVRVILLVRDPRGTMQSRKHRVWCGGNADCDDPRIVCDDLVADFKTAEMLLKKYPKRFRTLRYEDLSVSPYETTQEVLQFYGLPFDHKVTEFLDTHTKENIGGVSSTYRDSRSAPFHWKQELKIEEIKNIQEHCTKAMDLWGYRKIENFTDFQHTFDPIILPSPFA